MRDVFTIQDSLENKISYYHLVFFVIMLPFDRFYTELILISFTLHTLIHINKQRILLIVSWKNLILSSVFLLNVLGMIWSQDKGQALKDMQRQLAILLFPLALSATGINLVQYKKRLFIIFGFTCVLTILYLYADAIHIIVYNHLPITSLLSRFFINHNFSLPIGIHATYLAMYVALSVVIFLDSIIKEKKSSFIFIYAAFLIILLAGLLQLASRSVLIATFFFIIPGFFLFTLKGIKRVKVIIATLIISLIIFFGITRIDSFKKRYVAELENDLTQAPVNNEILEPRVVRWHYALRLVYHSPIIGFGSGSEKRLLKEKYFENKLYISYLEELNAHNQYLSFLIKTGALGLIVFFITLYTGFVAAWRNHDFVFCSFMILVSIVSFSENILDVNKGVFFYAFFFSFFILSGKPFDKLFRLVKRKKS
jgi:O-antigen ligase